MKPRFIVFDGADGTGKTTQLKKLGSLISTDGTKVEYNRLLGGDGKDFVQNKLRALLLDPEFPADSVETEEELFGVTDRRGIKIARGKLESGEADVVLQDRGFPSHLAYALAKGMSQEDVELVHSQTWDSYVAMAEDFGALHIVMIPEDERLAMERVQSRGEQVTPRLENLETQKAVINELLEIKAQVEEDPVTDINLDSGAYVFITVKRGEDIDTVHANILNALESAGIEI